MPVVWQDLTPLSTRWPQVIRRFVEKGRWVAQCASCGTMAPRQWITSTAKDENGQPLEACEQCSERFKTAPDVYWDGKPEHGLADDPVTGKPRVFSSRGEKAAYLRERGLQEAGDRTGGAYRTPGMAEGVDRRDPEIARRALAKVGQMGQDVRRQAYLKILKESGRA